MNKAVVLLTPLILFLITACSEVTVERDELLLREGVFYEKFATKPFSGFVKGRVSGAVKDGRWNGKVYVFTEEGNLERETNYEGGVREGIEIIYARGQRVQEKTFRAGDLNNFKRYFNGVMQINENFTNEQKHGLQEYFWGNGNLMYRVNYVEGELTDNIVDVYSSDARTHLEVPVTHDVGRYLVADGIVKIAGDETCGVEYDIGRDPVLKVDLEPMDGDPQANERNKRGIACTTKIIEIVENVGLQSLYIKDLFPPDE